MLRTRGFALVRKCYRSSYIISPHEILFLFYSFYLWIFIDVNECLIGHHDCSHQCRNIVGGFYCDCPPDMILGFDNITCLQEDYEELQRDDAFSASASLTRWPEHRRINPTKEMRPPGSHCPGGFNWDNEKCQGKLNNIFTPKKV